MTPEHRDRATPEHRDRAAPEPPAIAPLPPPTIVDDAATLANPTRQSPLAPLFILWAGMRSISIVNFGFLFAFGAFGRFAWAIPLVIALGALTAVASWWRATFQIVGDELVTERGVLSRERKNIPLERIQSVTIEQKLLHRIFGLVEAKVETAGSSSAELTLEAVSRPTAESIRRLAIRHNSVNTDAAIASGGLLASEALGGAATAYDPTLGTPITGMPPGPPSAGLPQGDAGERILLHRTLGDIFRVALSSNPLIGLGTAAAAIFGLTELFGERLGASEQRLEDFADDVLASPLLIAGIIVVFVAFFAVAALLSAMVPLHELTLFRTASGLRSASGLLSRRERVAPLERVQLLSTSQNPVQAMLGIRTVSLPTAGSRGDDGDAQIKLPGTTTAEYEELRDLVLPAGAPFEAHTANQISTHAIGRWTLWGGVVPALVTAVALFTPLGWFSLLSFAVVPFVWLITRRAHRHWRWSISDEAIEVSYGPFSREQRAMPLRKTQAVQLQRNIFHRRRGLASVKISSAASSLTVPHLPLMDAKQLRDELLFRCETDPRPHM